MSFKIVCSYRSLQFMSCVGTTSMLNLYDFENEKSCFKQLLIYLLIISKMVEWLSS